MEGIGLIVAGGMLVLAVIAVLYVTTRKRMQTVVIE